jgi:nucleoside-diphosphate-sugar epimerase
MLKSKILVSGASGFIGSHLMEVLDNAIGYDLKSGQDIRDPEQLYSYMKNVDIVVHLAAETSIAQCWNDPVNFYSHNILGTATVIQTAIKAGIKKIIYASSASVYQPYANPYSVSKYTDEALFETHKDQIKSVGMRFMNVYGKGQNKAYGTVIPAFYEGFKSKKGIKIYGNGKQTRDYIHVDDICRFIQLAINTDNKQQHLVLDVGTGKSISVNKLADMFTKLMHKTKITHIPARKEVKFSKANTYNQIEIFNFKPKVSLEEGLRRVVEEGI